GALRSRSSSGDFVIRCLLDGESPCLTRARHPRVFAVFSLCKSSRGPEAAVEPTFTLRLRVENRPVIAGWKDRAHMGRRPGKLSSAIVAALVLAALALAVSPAGLAAGNASAREPRTTVHGSSPKAAPGQAAKGAHSAQGVVQSLTPSAVVLREL